MWGYEGHDQDIASDSSKVRSREPSVIIPIPSQTLGVVNQYCGNTTHIKIWWCADDCLLLFYSAVQPDISYHQTCNFRNNLVLLSVSRFYGYTDVDNIIGTVVLDWRGFVVPHPYKSDELDELIQPSSSPIIVADQLKNEVIQSYIPKCF